MTIISSIPASQLPATDIVIIDVRTEEEHIDIHLAQPHTLVPLDQLDANQFVADNNLTDDDTVYILCRSGKRATTAAQMFINAGYTNIQVIEGGILACQASGIAVE